MKQNKIDKEIVDILACPSCRGDVIEDDGEKWFA